MFSRCVCVFFPFILDIKFVGRFQPGWVTQEEGHTGFLVHLPSAVRALIFLARRIQPFLSLVDREVEFCVNRQADPRMLDTHQAVLTGALRPTESRALSQDPDGKGRSNRSPSVWMQYVDPSPGTLPQTSCRTPAGLASHHRGAAQETRPPDDPVQPCS